MKQLAAFSAAAVIGVFLAAAAWQDSPAQDATRDGIQTCKVAGR